MPRRTPEELSTYLLDSLVPSHPTTVEEKRAITSLKNDSNITIVPADKGGATKILNKADYKAIALQQLSDAEAYATVTTDPTPKQTRAIQKTLAIVGSPTYNLSKWMFTYVKPIVADSEHSISN